MAPLVLKSFDDLKEFVGREINIDWFEITQNPHTQIRRSHRRSPVDPSRSCSRETGVALWRHHRARIPDTLATQPLVTAGAADSKRRRHDRELRVEPRPGSGTGS